MRRWALAAAMIATAPGAHGQCELGLQLVGENLDLAVEATSHVWDLVVVHNTAEDEYLVVFHVIDESNDLYGQRVAADGTLIGTIFPIVVDENGQQTDPFVAYNSLDNTYLVVWKYQFAPAAGGGSFNNAFGQRLDATGAALGEVFHVSNGGFEHSLAYNSQTNEFLHEGRNFVGGGDPGIRGQRIAGDGTLVGPNFTITVAAAPGPAGQVAYNSIDNTFLATWRVQAGAAEDLRGQRIAADGRLIGSAFIISTIYPSPNNAASLVFDPRNDRFLVTFGAFHSRDVFGQFVSGDGELDGDLFVIGTSDEDKRLPHVAYVPLPGAFLVVWQDRFSVVARLIADTGELLGEPQTLAAGTVQGRCRVAGNPSHGEFLVVWPANIGEPDTAYGQIVAVRCLCRADLDDNGTVGTSDLLQLLAVWGSCPGCPEDLDRNGLVGTADLLALLAAWGPCPSGRH